MARDHAYRNIPSVETQRNHLSFQYHENIPLIFCTDHVTIHLSQKRQVSAANSSQDTD